MESIISFSWQGTICLDFSLFIIVLYLSLWMSSWLIDCYFIICDGKRLLVTSSKNKNCHAIRSSLEEALGKCACLEIDNFKQLMKSWHHAHIFSQAQQGLEYICEHVSRGALGWVENRLERYNQNANIDLHKISLYSNSRCFKAMKWNTCSWSIPGSILSNFSPCLLTKQGLTYKRSFVAHSPWPVQILKGLLVTGQWNNSTLAPFLLSPAFPGSFLMACQNIDPWAKFCL